MEWTRTIARRTAAIAVWSAALLAGACTSAPAEPGPAGDEDGRAAPVDVAAPVDATRDAAPDAELMTGPPPVVDAVDVGAVVDGKVPVVIRGTVPDDCTEVSGAEWARADTRFTIGLITQRPAAACPDVVTPFEYALDLPLSGLKAGEYSVEAGGMEGAFDLDADQPPAAAADSGTGTGAGGGAATVITCADTPEGELRLLNLEAGYCANHPAEYSSQQPAGGMDLIGRADRTPLPNSDEFGVVLSIESIADWEGTSDDLAAERLAGMDQAELGVTLREVEIDGLSAVVADGVPGLATVRQAFVARPELGTAHILTVMPIDAGWPELTADAEVLWETVIGSIRFFDPPDVP